MIDFLNIRRRTVFAFFFIVIVFIIFIIRIFIIQFLPNKKLIQMKENQSIGVAKIEPKRGDILDRNGKNLAVGFESKNLILNPKAIKEPQLIASLLSKIINIDKRNILSKISNKKKNYVRIKRFLSKEEIEKIEKDFNINDGVYLENVFKREYPNNNLASHILGFVDIDQRARSGVELYYDNYIKGENKSVVFKRDGKKRALYNEDLWNMNLNSIYLTIDQEIQYRIEEELEQTVSKWEAVSGSVIVMNPNNGEILALANYPSFNSNHPGDYSIFETRNRAIMDLFEPGSTFKIITAALALKYEVIDLEEKLWGENGNFRVRDRVIKEAGGHDYGWMNLEQVIAKSSNVCSAKLALRLGEKMHTGVREFGFGEKTYIDLPGEVRGILSRDGSEVRIANMGFGQGISVTPIQMVKAYSIIANGGYDVTPHVVKEIVSEEGEKFLANQDEKGSRILDSEIAKVLSQMLRTVVTGGTGTGTDIKGFEVAGKTGTAQKPIPGGYAKDKYIASFAGFFPISKPKYVVIVLIDEPKKEHYANIVVVPLFRQVVNILTQSEKIDFSEKSYNYDEIKFDYQEDNEIKEVDLNTVIDFRGMSMREALKHIHSNWDDVEINGSGYIYNQDPLPGDKKDSKILKLWLK